jgi:ABC-type phosphate transport system substrate-binding protein
MRVSSLVIVIALVAGLAARPVHADTAFTVIVNSKNKLRSIEKKTVSDAFLKKRTQWSDDVVIQPVDQRKSAPVRRTFSQQVLGRSVEAVRTYWNRLVFSGRGVPPPELDGDAAVVTFVAQHPGAIGYVASGTSLNGDVKAVEVK